jgi:hypothetical protein
MKQILHIFRKDVRRHWPEILIGLVLVALFTQVALEKSGAMTYDMRMIWWGMASKKMIRPLLIFFWVFLAVRVVQGESLVGDRQWWMTKPYEWWKLLAAKKLFLAIFACGPLFFSQLYLLHAAHFPTLQLLGGIVRSQIGLAMILLLPGVLLGSLTKNLGQAVLGLVMTVVVLLTANNLLDRIPNNQPTFATDAGDTASALIALVTAVGVTGWQYARRRTWASRGLLLGCAVSISLLGAITPYSWFLERNYPLVSGDQSPVRLYVGKVKHEGPNTNNLSPARDVSIALPLRISAVQPGHLVVVKGIRISATGADGSTWEPGWRSQSTQAWAGEEQSPGLFTLRFKDYVERRDQSLRLHVEQAITEYAGVEERNLILPAGEFSDPLLGTCQLDPRTPSQIECRRPFHDPSLIASVEPGQANCQIEENSYQTPETGIAHAWFFPVDENSFEPALSPLQDYQMFFGSRQWQLKLSSQQESKLRVAKLCPGVTVKLAKTVESRRVRVAVDIEDVRLADLVQQQPDWD